MGSDASAAANSKAALTFWGWAMIVGPPIAVVLPILMARLLGGYEDFQLINKPVTFLEALGILGAMCFPFGVFKYARSRWNQTRAHASRTWPTTPGQVHWSRVEERVTGLPMWLYKLAL